MSTSSFKSQLAQLVKQNEEEKKVQRTAQAELIPARSQQAQSAATLLASIFPELSGNHLSVIANAITDIITRAQENGIPLTPFSDVPEVTIASPNNLISFMKANGYRVPVTILMNSPDKDKSPSLNSLAVMAGINRGSFNSVAQGRQHLSPKDLELWRDALVQIGMHNDIESFTALSNPLTFLNSLINEYLELESSLPVTRIKEWAQKMVDDNELTEEEVEEALERLNDICPVNYARAMVKVWRDQYLTDNIERFDSLTFLDLLSTRTSSRRFSRGLQNLTAAIHADMPQFNSRIKYPKHSYTAYRARYSINNSETGLTSEVLLGYCFYLGLNPIAVLYWLASKAAEGTFRTEPTYDVNGLVEWQGVMSPKEYDRFVDAIMCLGVVPDLQRWTLTLIKAKYVYQNLPTPTTLTASLGRNSAAYQETIDQYMEWFDFSTSECRLPSHKFGTHLDALTGYDFTHAHKDQICLALYLQGLASLPGNRIAEEVEALDPSEWGEFARKQLISVFGSTSVDSYIYKVFDDNDELDRAQSCQAKALTARELAASSRFYRGLFELIEETKPEDDEDDDLLSLMNQ